MIKIFMSFCRELEHFDFVMKVYEFDLLRKLFYSFVFKLKARNFGLGKIKPENNLEPATQDEFENAFANYNAMYFNALSNPRIGSGGTGKFHTNMQVFYTN